MGFVFQPAPVPSVAVAGTRARLPVRRIFCVGRNCAAHAREMGKDPDHEPPFFFTKPSDAVVDSGESVAYPLDTGDFHHEVELVAVIGTAGHDIAADSALEHIWGYAVGNDLTRRDRQLEARDKGRPWDWGKAFDRSAVIGPVHPVGQCGHPCTGSIRLSVNGVIRQHADLDDLIWAVPEIVSFLSHSIALRRGDLIMTGTPAGVGPLQVGDICDAANQGLGEISTVIGPRA